MIRLSVNVNKVATVRNSRGGAHPRVLDAVEVCLAGGAHGVTVHPRADRRHITPADVRDIAAAVAAHRAAGRDVELNVEGDPRDELLDLVAAVRPDQCTLVPVRPGEITSQAGWSAAVPGAARLQEAVRTLRTARVRVSLFVEPTEAAVDFAAAMQADRVELYTEPFARAFERGAAEAARAFDRYVRAAAHAHARGLGVNAGHDLDLENLVLFRTLPHLDEVSIGHAIISRAIFVGLGQVVREYLDVLEGSA
jgi:pyridoxine 5-phosphate synthase